MTLKDYISLIIEMLEANNKPLNGRLVLYSDELEIVTGVSINNQSNQRSINKFPFAYQKQGKKIIVSIVAVAKWLMELMENDTNQQLKPIFNQPMPIGSKAKAISRVQKKRYKAELSRTWFNEFKTQLQDRFNILNEKDHIENILDSEVKESDRERF
ncbi:hypothetical protein [Burkholderia vietnamiensis]|uniref:hypothetical protein n=1 Tax=Burkholderia vietnamiensis TaxID=60552 RepID=UPI001CF5C799|nr:hypothetical protein [Burkholderia vietnamiensis]MCA8285394.1 hypothetical protein [Burkholderia vietnamiensis]